MTSAIGIDISKDYFDVAYKRGRQIVGEERFRNNEAGFAAFGKWVKNQQDQTDVVVMEATGVYGDDLAEWLYARDYAVSVVNPFQIKAYGQAQLSRAKTDKADARLIADFGCTQVLLPWKAPSPERRELRSMIRYRTSLVELIQEERQRLEASSSESVYGHITTHLSHLETTKKTLEAQIKAHVQAHPPLAEVVILLTTICGVADLTAATLVAEIDIDRFDAAKELVAFMGLNPSINQSGKRAKTATPISKMGHAHLRHALYMPTQSAKQHNKPVRALYRRLVDDKGKHKKLATVAAMRKLVHIIYGVWKSGQPFDPDYEVRLASATT